MTLSGGAGFQRQIHQDLSTFAQVLGLADHALHYVASYVVEPVGAEQPAFARFDVQDIQVQLRAGIDVAQDAHEDVLVRMRFRFLRAEAAFVNEALHEGVVNADLLKLLVAQPVGTGIANVGKVELAALQEQRRDRGAHARELGILVDKLGEQGICGLDLVSQDGVRASG